MMCGQITLVNLAPTINKHLWHHKNHVMCPELGEQCLLWATVIKEDDGQKQKMDGTRDKNAMIIVYTRDGL